MWRRVVYLFLAVSAACMPAATAETGTGVVTPFFGLAVPYPDEAYVWTVRAEGMREIRNRSELAYLVTAENGKVKQVLYPPDSGAYIEVIEDKLRKVAFRFHEGRALFFPLTIPVRISYAGPEIREKTVTVTFPVSEELTTDSSLLRIFFEKNGVTPPRVVSLPSIFYRVHPEREEPGCMTVTARVFLDDGGALTDITYPVPGQDIIRHPVQAALIHAVFEPARLNGQPFAADFLLTFRIFDNLEYPFAALAPADTAATPITGRYFMTPYFHANDLSVPALPRTHASGFVRSAKYGRRGIGATTVNVRIDANGLIDGILVSRASPGLLEAAREAVKLIRWYPAVNNRGERVPFRGNLRLTFDGSTKIVYNAEWLSP